MNKSFNGKNVLKGAGVLLVISLLVFSTLNVAANINIKKHTNDNKECGCCQGDGIDLTVGICDNFTLPTEPTFPSQILLDWIDNNYPGDNGSRECDDDRIDQYWAHTFDFTGICNESYIIGATLTITMWNGDSNDRLLIGCLDNIDDNWDEAWYLVDDLNIQVGHSDTIEIDLLDYPSFFSDMLLHEYLDVAVQDDSAVDCAILTIYCCECQLEVIIKTGLTIGAGTIPVIIQNVGTTDCDNISYSITITKIFGSVSGSLSGYTQLTPGEEIQLKCGIIGRFGIFKITVEVEACGHIYTDTAYGIILGPFILVI